MSDVPTTPTTPAFAPAPAPAASEVPINQAPVNSPNPVGSQAPDKSDSDRRREAIQQALDRASKVHPPKVERQAPKAAEAKPGHNNPPGETPKETPNQTPNQTPRLDLKRRPDDQQPRGDRGQFVPKQRDGNSEQRSGAVNAGQNGQPGHPSQSGQAGQPPHSPPQLPSHAPYAAPPQRMSEYARREWDATPESVRGEIWRQQQEFSKAYQYYKDDHEAYKPIKHFAKLAQDSGTNLQTALTNYIEIETMLRKDPIAGVDQIMYNLDIKDPQTGRRLDIRDLAYTVLSQTPEQLKTTQMGNAQNATQYQIGAVLQKLERLENENKQMHYAQQFNYTRSAIDQFAETHPRMDELSRVIEQELKFGFNLETAYRRAEALYPATHAAQTRTTSAQTRPDRSIHGNPDVAPSNGASRKSQKASASPREATLNAMRRMNGAY